MTTRTRLNEDGVVAIIVSVIIMVVVTLITLGFAQIARREQRQALDKQLSVEAYYAAESGINDAQLAISAGLNNKTQCDDPTFYPLVKTGITNITGNVNYKNFNTTTPLDNKMDFSSVIVNSILNGVGNGQTQYTCLLINDQPNSLIKDPVNSTNPWVAPMKSPGGHIDHIVVSWQDHGGSTAFSSAGLGTFPTPASWGATTGVLRVDLTDLSVPLDYNGLSANTITAFMYPSAGGSNTMNWGSNVGFGKRGNIVSGKCSVGATPKYCNVTIDNLPHNGLAAQQFYIHISSIYNTSSVELRAYDSSGNQLNLQGAQVIIDSTGKASDVLHRIQVRKDISNLNDTTIQGAALQTVGSLCKSMDTEPSSTTTTVVNGKGPSGNNCLP